MKLTQDIHAGRLYNYQSHIHSLVGLILHQKFQENEIGNYLVGNLSAESPDSIKQDSEQTWLTYFDFFFPPEENLIIKPELFNALKKSELNKVYFFFQRERPKNRTDYKWYFSTSRLSLTNEGTVASFLFRYAFELNKSENKTRSLADENYFQKYCNRVMLLSKREKDIVKLIVDGKSSVDISEQLYIGIAT